MNLQETVKSFVKEAMKTPCQTPNAQYDIEIHDKSIEIKVELPMQLELSKGEAKLLEANLHNMLELTLSKYFKK